MYVAEITLRIEIVRSSLLPPSFDYLLARNIAANSFKELHSKLVKYYMATGGGYARADKMYDHIMSSSIGERIKENPDHASISSKLWTNISTADPGIEYPSDELSLLVCPNFQRRELSIGLLEDMEQAMIMFTEATELSTGTYQIDETKYGLDFLPN